MTNTETARSDTNASFRSSVRFGPQVASRVTDDWVERPYTLFGVVPKSPTIESGR